MRRTFLFVVLLTAWTTITCSAAEPTDDERLLNEVKIGSDGPSVVAYFKKRILPDDDRKRVGELIRQLGNDDFELREQATSALLAIGPAVLPQLKDAVNDRDPEIVQRARYCLDNMERVSTSSVIAAAVRVLGLKEPDKTAELLLAFAPQADSEYVREAIRESLKRVAVREKKPDAALVAALKDKVALRRALAVEILLGAQVIDVKDAQPYLKDSDAVVRLRVALALIERDQKEAVPTLIALYKDLPVDQIWQIDDVLYQLAGDNAPKVPGTGDVRGQSQKLWQAWWDMHGEKVDLKAIKDRPAMQGLTLVVFLDPQTGWPKIVELGRDNKPRWEMANFQSTIVDAQYLPGDRLLVAEYNTKTVTERNRKGEVVWSKQVTGFLIAAHRLADGNTFIAMRNGVTIVDAKGEAVMTYNRKLSDLGAAVALPNGEFLLLTRTGTATRIDKTGKEVKTFAIERFTGTVSISITPKGNFLLPTNRLGKVIEYDIDGNTIETLTQANATSAQRLLNGNMLYGCSLTRKIIEVDRAGKVVNETTMTGNVSIVRRR